MPMTTIGSGADPLRGYLARPSGEGPWPAVLVVHEAWGLDVEMRRAADRLAGMGYLSLAPDLYRGQPLRCIRAVFSSMLRGHGPAFDDLEEARTWLADAPESTGAVGAIGFCMGGGFALLLGATGRYRAVSANYGKLPATPEVLRDSCPVVASYGAKDAALRGSADKLERALTAYGVPHDVEEYPDAGHSFLVEQPNGPALLRPIMGLLDAGPEPASAADAWRRIEGFFDTHLR